MADAPDDAVIELSASTFELASVLAAQLNLTVPQILERSVKELQSKLFFEEASAQYAALRADPVAWNEELQERAAWDATLMDDLHDDPYP